MAIIIPAPANGDMLAGLDVAALTSHSIRRVMIKPVNLPPERLGYFLVTRGRQRSRRG